MQCINENSREYQILKKQSGLSDFVLSAYVGDFLETHDRFPYLDELPEADSSKAISEDLSLNKDNTTKTENILQATNTNTVEEAVPVLNDKYRDKEIEVLEVGSKSKVYITTRPNTTQNQDGETDKQIKIATEIADIKERALANGTFMLAPNGKPTNLTEQQWLQVRTQEFKDWFGDWENDPENASKVVDDNGEPLVVYHGGARNINAFKLPNNKAKISFDDTRNLKWAKREGYVISEEDLVRYNNGEEVEVTKPVGVYFAADEVVSRSYFGRRNIEDDGLYATFLNIRNPYVTNKEGKQMPDDAATVEDLQKAKDNNQDGVIIENVRDYGPNDEERMNWETNEFATYPTTDYIIFNSNQIKSATDNNGQFSSSNDNINDDYENVNSFAFFNEIIDKLQTLYGINIIPITNAELSQDRWASITGTKGVKSFIYNGNIYINTDIATVDSPVHEFLHLLFGSMKYQNRTLYDQLVGQAEQFDSYNTISKNYPNRTIGDINEEVFVTELAKYLTGQNNAISNLDQSIQNEIIYNVNRTLDTVLMGENSVKCVENPYIMNLKTLARLVNSSTMISEKRGSLTDATLNRMMANTKSELMRNKELREECQ